MPPLDTVQEKLNVRATVCDSCYGGRNFDDVIIEWLAAEFQAKTKIDVRGNVKAILKLQVAAEKAKKTLSPQGVGEANVSVECLADDRDLNTVLSKEEFERISRPLLSRYEQSQSLLAVSARLLG
jgi:heat shock 70kDa protein 4